MNTATAQSGHMFGSQITRDGGCSSTQDKRIVRPALCRVQESGVPAHTPLRLSSQKQYDRVFSVAMPGEQSGSRGRVTAPLPPQNRACGSVPAHGSSKPRGRCRLKLLLFRFPALAGLQPALAGCVHGQGRDLLVPRVTYKR